MNDDHETNAPWEEVAPHLDAALAELNEPDRDAVLLRYPKTGFGALSGSMSLGGANERFGNILKLDK